MNFVYGTIASLCDAHRFVAHEVSQNLGCRPISLLHHQSFVTEFGLSQALVNRSALPHEVEKAQALFTFYKNTLVLHGLSFGIDSASPKVRIAALSDTIATQWHDYAEEIFDATQGGRSITNEEERARFQAKVRTCWNIAGLYCSIAYICILATHVEDTDLRELFILLSKLDELLIDQIKNLHLIEKIIERAQTQLQRITQTSISQTNPAFLVKLETRIWETHHGTYGTGKTRKKDWTLMKRLLREKWRGLTASAEMAEDLSDGIVSVSRKHDEVFNHGSPNFMNKLRFALHFWRVMSRVYANLYRLNANARA